MYTNGIPCTDCAKAIIQSGIIEVVTDEWWNKIQKEEQTLWSSEAEISLRMFQECGVGHREINNRIVEELLIHKSGKAYSAMFRNND